MLSERAEERLEETILIHLTFHLPFPAYTAICGFSFLCSESKFISVNQ